MPKLLIVDDQVAILHTLALALGGKYEVQTAWGGLIALEIARDYKPDVVLTDFAMLGMTGLDLLIALKRLPQPPKVIMFSALMTLDLMEQAKNLGASACLSKPFDLQEMEEKIEKALGHNKH